MTQVHCSQGHLTKYTQEEDIHKWPQMFVGVINQAVEALTFRSAVNYHRLGKMLFAFALRLCVTLTVTMTFHHHGNISTNLNRT